ncbi:MAG: methyltransferase [Candidatus Bathyarchaeia archaeon]
MGIKPSKHFEHYFTAKPKAKPEYMLIRDFLRGRSFQFLTASGVFSKKRIDLGTKLLIESMVLPDEGLVLDIGCGYGAVGIVAASLKPNVRVIMTDINERAVWLAKRNIQLNGIFNAEVRRGDLYNPVRELTFNCILSNPPVSAGLSVVKEIVTSAPQHMAEGAVFQMVVRSKVYGERLKQFFTENFGNVEVLARGSGYRVLISRKYNKAWSR